MAAKGAAASLQSPTRDGREESIPCEQAFLARPWNTHSRYESARSGGLRGARPSPVHECSQSCRWRAPYSTWEGTIPRVRCKSSSSGDAADQLCRNRACRLGDSRTRWDLLPRRSGSEAHQDPGSRMPPSRSSILALAQLHPVSPCECVLSCASAGKRGYPMS